MSPYFKAPWGRSLSIFSLLLTLVLITIMIIGWIAIPPHQSLARMMALLAPLLIMAGASLFIVRGYTLEGRRLLVHRLLWQTEVPLDGLRSVVRDPEAMNRSIRVFGNGGMYSFTGLFRNKKLGLYRSFVNDFHRSVVLHLPRRPVVISPDDPERFTEAVKNLLPG